MTDNQLSRPSGTVLHTLHTVWIYWPEDDAIELHGALDQHVLDANHEAYAEMVNEAAQKVGKENIRQIRVEVDWADICAAFEPPPKIEGQVSEVAF